MKITLSTNEVADHLFQDKDAGWTWAGARALAEYLEEVEESAENETELDVVAIRCDFSEYESLQDFANDYFGGKDYKGELGLDEGEDDEDTINEAIKSHIEDNGTLIEFEGGIIVSSF